MFSTASASHSRVHFRLMLVSGLAAFTAFTAQAANPDSQSAPRNSNRTQASQDYGKLPLGFEANQGQADGRVKFLSRGKGYSLYLTGNAAVLALTKDTNARKRVTAGASGANSALRAETRRDFSGVDQAHKVNGASAPDVTETIQMQLVGANPTASVEGATQLPGIANYLIGNDPAKWRTNIPTYAKVRYSRVYNGIDLVFYGNQSQLEYDFVVAPSADPGLIRLRFAGASHLELTPAGDLVVSAGSDETASVSFRRPEVYQQSGNRRVPVNGAFRLASPDTVVFRLGSYDRSRPLVIDPTLDYSTGFGGTSGASAHAVAFDAEGNVYLAGSAGPGLTTLDPFQATANSNSTGFISEINSAGTALVYSTYFGGSGGDSINCLAIDSSGNIYVAGSTGSKDFPTMHPIQAAPTASPTGFVSEIKAGGASLVYSTYLGGSNGGSIAGIAVDGAGDAYVAGSTESADFPLENPIQKSNNDPYGTGFVSEIAADGASLVYSTYLGGSGGCGAQDDCGGDQVLAIAADEAGNAYVSGATQSYDFPTANALQSTNNNVTSSYTDQPYTGPNMGTQTSTGFVSKIQPGGGAFVYSTYLGGSGQCDTLLNYLGYDALISCSGDSAASIVADAKGNAYIAGTASSPDFPLAHPFQSSVGPVSTGFISVLNPQGSAFLYSTFLGGSGYCDYPEYNYDGESELCFGDGLSAIGIDASENVYVAGNASSSNVPLKYPLPSQSSFGPSGTSPYISALKSGGQSLLYSTYFGGSLTCNSEDYCVGDQATTLAADSAGDVVVIGSIASANFPYANPLPGMTGGSTFLAKISPASGPAATPVFSVAPGTYTTIQQVTISTALPEDIYYTTDGSTPTTHSALYRWPIVVTANETIKAMGGAPGYLLSAVASATYVVNAQAAAPVLVPASGAYAQGQTVAITDSTSNSHIYYTTDGSVPTGASIRYGGPILLGASETIKAIAFAAPANTPSPVSSAAYVVHLPLSEPVISLASGTYTTVQIVTVKNESSGAILHYTLDGTAPTNSSPTYTGPIYVAKTETLRVVAVAQSYPPSPIASAFYTIHLSLDEPVLSLASGTYTGAQTVTVTDGTSVALIFYTINGATPTASSPRYTGPITIGKSETLKVIAIATGYPPSTVAAATYTIK